MKNRFAFTIVLTFLLSTVLAQENEDFYQQVATLKVKTNPRKHTLVPSSPAKLSNIELESEKNNRSARIGDWNPLDTRAEFNEELTRLREEYKKYLQDFTPTFESTKYREYVHCFFAEPTSSPCMLLGLMTGLNNKINVHDFGLNNVTDADGLAVGSPSGFVGKTLQQMISGVFTVQDTTLYKMLSIAFDIEKISLEPSALAGMPGPFRLFHIENGKRYMEKHMLQQHMPNATHIVWATGGGMVPPDVVAEYYRKGINLR